MAMRVEAQSVCAVLGMEWGAVVFSHRVVMVTRLHLGRGQAQVNQACRAQAGPAGIRVSAVIIS